MIFLSIELLNYGESECQGFSYSGCSKNKSYLRVDPSAYTIYEKRTLFVFEETCMGGLFYGEVSVEGNTCTSQLTVVYGNPR